uniref:Neur_chan_LBD domain-containing protein n=1 Tax=Parastrongyloides trichosuri TaxID=131310 RepID=A0A0N4ZQK6_PARTI
MFTKIIIFSLFFFNSPTDGQTGEDQEFDPYVFKNARVPYKNNKYAEDWLNSDVAFLQSPFLAAAKPTKFHTPVDLPTIKPYIVKWSDLNNVKINEENTWNFEKRIDKKVWWPNK